jgi:DNA polymerase III delta prime subunit
MRVGFGSTSTTLSISQPVLSNNTDMKTAVIDLFSVRGNTDILDAIASNANTQVGRGLAPKPFLSVPVPKLQPLNVACAKTNPPCLPMTETSKVKMIKTSFSLPLTEKYRPQVAKDIFGNPKSVHQLSQWIQSRRLNPSTGKTNKVVATLTGPPGVGKTSSATVLLREQGFKVFEINASDERTKSAVYFNIKESVTRKPLGKPVAIILDEIDGSVANVGEVGESNSGVQGVLQFIHECKSGIWQVAYPVICICNNTGSKTIRQLIQQSESIRFFNPFSSVMNQALQRICQRENVHLNTSQHQRLVEASRGDFRRMYQLLQMYAIVGNRRESVDVFLSKSAGDEFDDIFSSTRRLIYNTSISMDDAERLSAGDSSIIMLMLQHNMPSLFSMKQTAITAHDLSLMATFYDDMSLADTIEAKKFTGQCGSDHFDSALLTAATTRVSGMQFRPFIRDRGTHIEFTSFFDYQNTVKSTVHQRQLAALALGVGVNDIDLAIDVFCRLPKSHQILKPPFQEDDNYLQIISFMKPSSSFAMSKKRKKIT